MVSSGRGYGRTLAIFVMAGCLWLQGTGIALGHGAAIEATIHWLSAAFAGATLLYAIRFLATPTLHPLRAAALFCVAVASAMTSYTTAPGHTQSTFGWLGTSALVASLLFLYLDSRANEQAG